MERMMAYLLAEGILLRPDNLVVVVEGLLELLGLQAHVLCELLAIRVSLHEATTNVVLAVPLNLLRGLTVEHQTDRVLKKQSRLTCV